MKIINKKTHHSGFEGFNLVTEDGKTWSVLNFGGKKWKDTYKNYPPEYYLATFRGWEAYNGDTDEIIRGETYEEIENEILKIK